MWDIEYDDEFEDCWNRLSEPEQIDVASSIDLLSLRGPNLPFPHSSGISNSNYPPACRKAMPHTLCF